MLHVIILSLCSLHLTYSQISRDNACDLSIDKETIIKPTTITYNFAFSASTISPKILYDDVGDQFTVYADIFNEEVRPNLAQEQSLGPSDVTTIRIRQSDRSEFALVDFVVSCEKNVSYDIIKTAMMNVATKTDYIDLNSLEVNEHVIYCLRQEFQTKVGTFTWPVTLEGSTVTTEEACSEESVNGVEFKLAVRSCIKSNTGAYWDSYQCTDCGGASASYLLQQLYESIPNGDSVEDLMRQVANITEMAGSVRVDGLEAAVNIIEYVVQQTNVSSLTTEIVDELVRIVHNIQQISSKTVTDAQGSSSTSSRLLKALHSVLTSMTVSPNVQFTSVHDSLIVFVDVENILEKASAWYQFGVIGSSSDGDALAAGGFSANSNEPTPIPIGNTMIYVQNMPEIGNYRKTFLLHQNDILFRSPSDELRLSATNSEYLREINTRIITTLATGDNIGQPKVSAYFQPIKINNKTLNEECQTWDWSKDDGKGRWTEEGCTRSVEGQHIHCSCNSYSSFAVAMDVYDVPITIPPKYTISRVGSVIATVLLLLTVLIFVCLKDLRNSKPHQILSHLFSALAVWHFFFAVGITTLTSNRGICATFGIIMHYGILVALCWMIVGAIDIYIVFVKARALPIKRFVLKASALAWGIPLVIVIIVAAIDLDSYREEDKHCFIVKSPALAFILSMVVPVFAAICSISIIYLMACTMSVPTIDGKIEDEGDPMFRKRQQARVLVIASSVIVILGILTIIFGFIAIFSASTGTEVVFFLFSILEGSAIFGTCCVWPSEVRHLWLKRLGVLKRNPTKQGVFQPYWSLSKWTSKSVLPEAEPQFFLDNTVNGNGIITPQNIVLETFPISEMSGNSAAENMRESTA